VSDAEARDRRSGDRLPIDLLRRVTAAHVERAVGALLAGAAHPFGESTDFDLLTWTGERLPPKAVFGLAATDALGFKVLPKHFTGGLGTPSFQILEAAGFRIEPKASDGPAVASHPPKPSRALSTQPGHINRNDQVVLGPTGRPGTDHGQSIYVLQCCKCGHDYGANGTDIAGRRCPNCQGGRPGFAVTAADVIDSPDASAPMKGSRNPPWTRDELILALDLYFDHPSPNQSHPKVIELSKLLNRLWAGSSAADIENLRNPNGVSMKLSNFQRMDPRFKDRGRKGLPNGARADVDVWEDFSGDRQRLAATATAIRLALENAPELATGVQETQDAEAEEGAVLTRLHHYRERDASLARKRKEQARAQHGRLVCDACEFDFALAYGPRGDGYIEVHHTKALETLAPGAKTKLSELAVLCANCHRMVHAKRPWLTMDQLRALVRSPA
jgi:5-methylcytosine-specific restriction protein A